MKSLLAAGYLGCGNIGDDALLLALREHYPGPITALSGRPELTERDLGIPSIPRKHAASVSAAIAEHDILVLPGGSIFQDATSSRSVLYYGTLVKQAKRAGKKVVMLGQGVGPLTSFFGKRWARQAFLAADEVVVRDPDSERALRELGVQRQITVAADMAFLLTPPSAGSDTSGFGLGDMKTVALAPRPHGKGNDMVELFSQLSRALFNAGFNPMLIEMDREIDGPLIERIDKENGGKVPSIRKIGCPAELMRRLQRMDGMIAVRLHAGILATAAGLPTLMLNYDPKVASFARSAELPTLPVNPGSAARVLDTFMPLLKDRDQWVIKQRRTSERLRNEAMKNIEVLRRCVG